MHIRERGIGNLAFIAVLVLFIIALAMFFVTKDDADTQKALARKWQVEVRKSDTTIQEWKDAYQAMKDVVGIVSPDLDGSAESAPQGPKIRAVIQAAIYEKAQACQAAAIVSLKTKNFNPDVAKGKIISQEADETKVLIFTNPISKDNGTVRAFLDLFPEPFINAKAVAEVNNDKNDTAFGRQEANRAAYKTALDTNANNFENKANLLQNTIDSQKGELTNLRESLEAQSGKYDTMSTELETVKQTASKERRDNQLEVSAYQNRLANERIKKELALAEDPKDGEVVAVSKTRGTVWINLGKNQRLARGTKFKVWRAGKGNMRQNIAVIEITSVDSRKAEATIIKSLSRFSVTKGMNISNPFYDPRGKLRAYIFGNLRTYTTDVARRRLAKSGVEVARSLDDRVNVIILGEPPVTIDEIENEDDDPGAADRLRSMQRAKRLEEILEKARSINALVVNEDALVTFIEF